MQKLLYALATCVALGSASMAEAETIRMTAASSHPTAVAWVGQMKAEIVDKVNARLEEIGSDSRIEWTEAYGGVLYGFKDTLEAVSDGVADMGWVGALFEPAKMPLQNVPYALPFSTPEPLVALDIMDELSSQDGIFKKEWTDNNLVYLGTMATDGYQIYSKTPIRTPADLKGMKVLSSASVGPWVEGYGASFVSAGIPVMYNQLETGVGDAVFLITSGAAAIKLHEVAPYVTVLDMGPAPGGGPAMNKDKWDSLPEDVQKVFKELGQNYNKALAADVAARREKALADMEAAGVTLIYPTEEERAEWVAALPDIAGTWASAQEARGVPANEAIKAFMTKLHEKGITPLRDWTVD